MIKAASSSALPHQKPLLFRLFQFERFQRCLQGRFLIGRRYGAEVFASRPHTDHLPHGGFTLTLTLALTHTAGIWIATAQSQGT